MLVFFWCDGYALFAIIFLEFMHLALQCWSSMVLEYQFLCIQWSVGFRVAGSDTQLGFRVFIGTLWYVHQHVLFPREQFFDLEYQIRH